MLDHEDYTYWRDLRGSLPIADTAPPSHKKVFYRIRVMENLFEHDLKAEATMSNHVAFSRQRKRYLKKAYKDFASDRAVVQEIDIPCFQAARSHQTLVSSEH